MESPPTSSIPKLDLAQLFETGQASFGQLSRKFFLVFPVAFFDQLLGLYYTL